MPQPRINLTLPDLHAGQRTVWEHPARFQVLSCGRRWGKSRLGALRCIVAALQGGRAWWVAPSYPMASVGWRMMKRLAVQIPGAVVRESDRLITMPGSGTVQVRSADDPDSLRGEGLDYLVMDECAFIRERAWTEALRPALADRRGRAMFISTPKGRNWFWRIWSAQDSEWRSWRFSSYDNPFIEPTEIDAARRLLPERIFAQEFLAEFIDDAGGVFRGVMAAATAEQQERGQPGREYVIGVDWGKHNDFTVLSVIDVGYRALVKIDRFNQIDYTVQTDRLRALCERFRPSAVVVERNSIGEPLIEMLLRQGLPIVPFNTTNASKAAIIDGLALAFERQSIQIIDDPVLLAELQAYEMERLPSGLLRYSAPDGLHDDCVMSLALAWAVVDDTQSVGGMVVYEESVSISPY